MQLLHPALSWQLVGDSSCRAIMLKELLHQGTPSTHSVVADGHRAVMLLVLPTAREVYRVVDGGRQALAKATVGLHFLAKKL